MKYLLLAATAAFGFATAPAHAALNVPVPTNTYITFNGADWAWASPCSPSGCNNDPAQSPLDLSYQSTQGWRLPTLAEMLLAPTAANFVFAGANVPFGGADANGTVSGDAPGDLACATAYFTTPNSFNLCNYGDAAMGAIYLLWSNPAEPNVETWVVRGEVNGVIPEPATWAMLIAGFGLVGSALRRRTAATA